MKFFTYFTPVSYWILIFLWSFIFIFYLRRIVRKTLESKLFITLLSILAIDAFRTVIESLYFGAWYTSLVGFLPKAVHDFLVRPEFVFIPKILNVAAAVLIIFIVLKRWVPEEIAERKRAAEYTETLKKEIGEREKVQRELSRRESQLIEAQETACIGHYILDINSGIWSSSGVLDKIFGIDEKYEKSVEGWLGLIHPDHRETMMSYLRDHVLGQHRKFDREYKIINAETGESLWVHGIGNLKFDEKGNPYEMFGTIQDISEHKRLVDELQEALNNIKVLGGLVPICSRCKNIRDDKGYWNQLETYVDEHSDISFSHSLCPDCAKELYGKEKWFRKMEE